MREVDDSHNVARTDKLLRLSKSEGYSKKFSHFCACLEQPSARADEQTLTSQSSSSRVLRGGGHNCIRNASTLTTQDLYGLRVPIDDHSVYTLFSHTPFWVQHHKEDSQRPTWSTNHWASAGLVRYGVNWTLWAVSIVAIITNSLLNSSTCNTVTRNNIPTVCIYIIYYI